MADTKISALPAVTNPAATDEFAVNQGGTSKKATLAQLRDGTTPTIVSVGAEFTSTGVPTATLPGTHALNDILVLVIQTANDSAYAAPAGYTRLGPSNGIGAAAAAGSTKLSIFWKRDNGSESAPTLTDAGDHTYGMMFAVRGCPTTGDPFRILGQAFKFIASTTGTGDAGATRNNNCLIINIFAHAVDSATAQGSSPTNASLTSVTENFDDATTDGTGGGIYVMSGIKAAAGDVSASTVTWAASTVDVSTTISCIPADAPISPRGPQTETFIGSLPDLDDTWTKPSGARRVFVQLCDGGNGGSGGNITTTAAGGGGGGGGGYDEAWFDAEELAATVTIHPGKGGAVGSALNAAGNQGTVSQFDPNGETPLSGNTKRRVVGTAASAAASGDGGNGGGGNGRGTTASVVVTTRIDLSSATLPHATANGGYGGSGTTAPTGGSPSEWGGGGGESGGDTDAAILAANNGWSTRGAGGGSGGRTNTNISQAGYGGGANGSSAAQGRKGDDSTKLPYGGAGGNGGGSSVVTGGTGGFPGGGGGGGAGVAGGFGGKGGDGCVVITTFF